MSNALLLNLKGTNMRAFKCKCSQPILVDDDNFDKLIALTWQCQGTYLRHSFWNKETKQTDNNNIADLALGVSCLPGYIIDHIDKNKHNNQRSNLRPATYMQNSQNRTVRSDSATGLKGVGFRAERGVWVANISVNKRRLSLGQFLNKIDAIRAYNEAAKKYHGEFAILNPEN